MNHLCYFTDYSCSYFIEYEGNNKRNVYCTSCPDNIEDDKTKNVEKNGIHVVYYENGQLELKGNFVDGKMEGPFQRYYENGQLQLEVNYKNDLMDGLYKDYYENGKLESEGNYKDGERDGKWYEWNSNGKKKRDGIFKNGKMISEKKYWTDLNLHLSSVGFYFL